MKNLLFILLLIIPVFGFAQNSGTIIYEETIQMDIDLPEDIPEEMKKQIPTSQSSEVALYFTEKESLFKNYDKADDSGISIGNSDEDGDTEIRIEIMRPENLTYCNYETNTLVDQRDFMGKKFLVKDELKGPSWKMTGKQKQVGKYVCQEASYQKDSITVVAYFTPQIPIAIGPSSYRGLPGAILEVNVDNGETVLVAKEIRLGEVPSDIIVEPTKGKKISDEAYNEIVEEKLKEMREENGGGTKIEIRID